MSQLLFYYDYSSPFGYLGATQVAALAARHDAELHWRPFLLGALFKEIGTPMVPFAEMPKAKQRWAVADMHRWAKVYGVPFAFPSRFPMNTVKALRMTLQLAEPDTFVEAVYRAYWAEDRDINDLAVLKGIADELGHDGAALLEGCQDQAVKDKLRAATSEAVAAKICGVPSYIVKQDPDDAGILFWGQDRGPLVERALDGWRPRCG